MQNLFHTCKFAWFMNVQLLLNKYQKHDNLCKEIMPTKMGKLRHTQWLITIIYDVLLNKF